jgi:transposase-like protein
MSGRQSEEVRKAMAYYRAFKSSGVSRYMAARKFGISPSTLYRALKGKK